MWHRVPSRLRAEHANLQGQSHSDVQWRERTNSVSPMIATTSLQDHHRFPVGLSCSETETWDRATAGMIALFEAPRTDPEAVGPFLETGAEAVVLQ